MTGFPLKSIVCCAALAFGAHYVVALRTLVDGRITPFLNAFSGIGWLFLAILWFGIDSTTVVRDVSATPRNSNSSRHCSSADSETHHSSSVPISVRVARR